MSDENFCGCCGRPCGREYLWCADCQEHIAPRRPPGMWRPWTPTRERTWFAQHGTDCPFQDAPVAVAEDP